MIVAGSCEEGVDTAFYQNVAAVTEGTFKWLPQGTMPETELAAKLTEVVLPIMIHLPTTAACLLYGVQDQGLNDSV